MLTAKPCGKDFGMIWKTLHSEKVQMVFVGGLNHSIGWGGDACSGLYLCYHIEAHADWLLGGGWGDVWRRIRRLLGLPCALVSCRPH